MKDFNRMYIDIEEVQGHYVVMHNVNYGSDQKSIAHGPDELIDLLSALVVENASMPGEVMGAEVTLADENEW